MGVSSLVVLSIFNEIPSIRGLATDMVVTPVSETPLISPTISMPQFELERRPDIKVQSIEVSTVGMRTSLDILVTQPLKKPQSDLGGNFVLRDLGAENSCPSDKFVMADQTLALRNIINLGQRANMQFPNVDSIVDMSPG